MRPRFKIATLAFLVVLLALDFAWMRLLHPVRGRSVFSFAAQGFDVGVLPMANVLAFGLYHRLSRRDQPHHFLTGFLIWGFGALILYMILCWSYPKNVLILIMPLYLAWSLWKPLSPSDPALLVVGAISFTVPQLLLAALGGWITRYFGRWRGFDKEEREALTAYVLRWHGNLVTKPEAEGLRAIFFEEKARTLEQQTPQMASEYRSRWGRHHESQVARKALKIGRQAFERRICLRILNQHWRTLSINRCPRCRRVLRTPKAQQCFWCGNAWHTEPHKSLDA